MDPLVQLAVMWFGVFIASLLAHNTRLTSVLYFLAFGVMDIAYLQNPILNTEAFYTLMVTAFFLNIAVPVTITLWKPCYDKAEAPKESRAFDNPPVG